MKKAAYALGILLAAALVWYMFLKPYDYLVSFEVNTFPGAIRQTIKTWGNTLEHSQIKPDQGETTLFQEVQYQDTTVLYRWEIKSLTDSTSRVRVYISDLDHSLSSRLSIPFCNTTFEQRTRKAMFDFHHMLEEHIGNFAVRISGVKKLAETFSICIAVNGTLEDKARGMMRNYPILSQLAAEHELPLNGQPYLEVTEWDRVNDRISYKFCFPIREKIELPENPGIELDKRRETRAIMAEYNGNYITSDRAWYALSDYARKEGISVTGLPVEVFFNNPNMGGNDREWKAEIYMPLKSTDE